MPLYDFECNGCDFDFEIFVPLKMFDEEVKCPKCNKPIKRKVAAPSFKVH